MDKKYVIFDIDGCIANDVHRRKFAINKDWDGYHGLLLNDSPMNQEFVNRLAENYTIIYCTGRSAQYFEDTELWLKTNFFPFGAILMRPENDRQSSVTLKIKLLKDYLGIEFPHTVYFGYDNDFRIVDAYKACGIPSTLLGIPTSMKLEDIEKGVIYPPPLEPKHVPLILTEAAELYMSRNTEYADNYKHFGNLMAALFPHGVPPDLITSNRFGVFVMLASKLARLASGGVNHLDSAKDMIVYAAMMTELIMEEKLQ